MYLSVIESLVRIPPCLVVAGFSGWGSTMRGGAGPRSDSRVDGRTDGRMAGRFRHCSFSQTTLCLGLLFYTPEHLLVIIVTLESWEQFGMVENYGRNSTREPLFWVIREGGIGNVLEFCIMWSSFV